MKKTLPVALLLAAVALWAAFSFQAAARARDYQELLRNGDTALLHDQAVEAIEAYSGAIALRPDSMIAHLRRGETYLRRGDLETAARDFQQASTLDRWAPRPLERLGDVRYRQDRFARAAELYDARLQLDDQSSAVTYKLALAHYRTRSFRNALAAVNRLLQLDPRLPEAHYLHGLCLAETGRLSEAADALGRAVAAAPSMVSAREELVRVTHALGRRGEEVTQLKALADLEPNRVERRVTLGLTHAQQNHPELAVLTLRNAMDATPDHATIYGAIGQVWLQAAASGGDPTALNKALEALERATATTRASSTTLTAYGRALAATGRLDAAERAFLQATERFPVDPDAFLEYAALAERHYRLNAARSALIRYDALAPAAEGAGKGVARAAQIGALSLQLQEPDAAAFWFQRASNGAPRDLRLLAELAEVQLRTGDRNAARVTVSRGLELDPSNEPLRALSRRM